MSTEGRENMERRSGMVKCVDLLNSNFDHGRGFLTIIINFGLISLILFRFLHWKSFSR